MAEARLARYNGAMFLRARAVSGGRGGRPGATANATTHHKILGVLFGAVALALVSGPLPAQEHEDGTLFIRQRDYHNARIPSETPPKQRDQLERSVLLEAALALSPENTRVVREEGEPMALFHDLQNDGLTDVAFVTVEGIEESGAVLAQLSSMSRLFDSSVTAPGFYIEVYAQEGGEVVPLHTFYLGRRAVFSRFEKVSIAEQGTLPVAFSVLFYSSNGEEQNWATFAPTGQVSLFIIMDTPTVRNAIYDIDNDGVIDVIEYRTSFEEGRGYETFVTWYRWSGASYARHATTNIVRNLNGFLDGVAERIANRRWRALVEYGLTPDQRESVAADTPPKEIVPRLLEPIRTDQGEQDPNHEFLEPEATISDVVLPDILENPFPSIGEETSFVAPIRIVCCGGITQYYSTQVVMQRNLFGERQFFLRLRGN